MHFFKISNDIIMAQFRIYRNILLLVLLFLFCSCTGKYFRDAGKPSLPPFRLSLSEWPYKEYWTGIIFNGAKIGFSRFTLTPFKENNDLFEIRSEAALRIRFLMFDKTINLKSYDQVAGDLSLVRFIYDYDYDGNRQTLTGQVEENKLKVEIRTRGQINRQTIPFKDKLYPTSIIGLYPVMYGLEVGRSYIYQVYNGETQTISPVNQDVLAYEESDLFPGKAFKLKTSLHGQKVTTWVDSKGRPLLEMSLGGVIIAELESEDSAKKYLAHAALNKEEALLDFSLIKTGIPILEPRQVTILEVSLSGIDGRLNMPMDERQQCEGENDEVFCRISSQIQDDSGKTQDRSQLFLKRYLMPSHVIPCTHQRISQLAREIVSEENEAYKQILLLLEWIYENIEKDPVDVFTALDVLENKKAECQGHTFLFSAFSRALGIPTRVVNGIVYSDEFKGFLYHTWAESFINEHWIAVDPTFWQMPADATHIKLIEGENISDLLPLVDLMGKIEIRVIDIHY